MFRSHIESDYLKRISEQSLSTNAANVGGIKHPIGESKVQKIIAKSMSHPLCFGGGKFRNPNFKGNAETVYLGAFNRNKMPPEPWFDEKHPKISEDSDLNFRIRKSGEAIYINSEIRVKYYCRETLKEFFNLCYNYGVGRGLFIIKHAHFSAWRQIVLPLSFFILSIFFGFGFIEVFYHKLFFISIITYLVIISWVSWKLSGKKYEIWGLQLISFIGCHLSWTFGFFNSIRIYKKDMRS
jgi:Predicted glycosyltransferases